jgi:hypothetical protein
VVQQIVCWVKIIEMSFLFNLKIEASLLEKNKIINHMFVRIVKLSFHNEENIFLPRISIKEERIRCAPGNRLLELYQDKESKSILHIAIGIPKRFKNTGILSFNEVWTFTKNYSTANRGLECG